MIKQSSFLKWAQNNKNSVKSKSEVELGGRRWIHPADALQKGHVAYLVKFLGFTEVEQSKGIEVVREGIRKLKFNQQLKRSEGGKVPKVELTISVDGVAVQDPKTKRIFHQHPLHRISYCADDKTDKKSFSFIAKESDGERHSCFVFSSEKLAEEITLTIGQAFDLAYRKFLETSGRDLEMRKQFMILQKRVQDLEEENSRLRKCLRDGDYSHGDDISSPTETTNHKPKAKVRAISTNGTSKPSSSNVVPEPLPPPLPPRTADHGQHSQDLFGLTVPTVGTRLENLSMDDLEDFNPRAETEQVQAKTNGCSEVSTNGTSDTPSSIAAAKDLFGAEPFSPTKEEDPFGMGDFSNNLGAQELENAIGIIDRRLNEMKDGFSRGLSFGKDDFLLEQLDPLGSKPLA
ncbi:PTB domain-containing engulfment adapter protein 1-like isoform X1 [Dermacentor variabilis]|uniref:PTB domain-containing engulfment adapter protein 1-like isoform X1 n=1 Tax=Dermacentor variabilis TaxID=34621 RepID=UPI003F5CB1C4